MNKTELVAAIAEKAGIKTQTQIRNRGNGTDAFAIRMTRSGVPVNLISIPLRYMHSAVEIVNLKDIDEISTLIAETIAALPANPKLGPTL
jgi:endoglucanase